METIQKRRVYRLTPNTADVLSKDSETYKRIQKQRKSMIDTVPHVCIERARIMTQAYKQMEHLPILMRRAKAFDAVLRQMSIFILEEERIAGHQSSMRRSAPLFPEFAV